MTQRTIEAIREDMHLQKLAFDALYITGDSAMNYSRASIQRQWALFQEGLRPLMRELARAEAIQTTTEYELARQLADDFTVSVIKKAASAA